MKIIEIGVKYFGIFTDFKVNLAPGMNLILGRNEAGKSTLLAFIRWVLFGFTRGSEKFNPPSGAVQNGYLLLELDDGRECLVRRQGKTLKGDLEILIDGKTHNEEVLENVLGPITENVYRNVFAFGLEELQAIKTLEDDEVSSFLYSGGLYPGNLPLSSIEKILEKQSKDLYSPQKTATKPVINKTMAALVKIDTELEKYNSEPEEYNACLTEMASFQSELQVLSAQIKESEDQKHWLNLLTQGWQLWKDRAAKEKMIKDLNVPDQFPLESLNDFEILIKELKICEEELETIKNRQKQQEEELVQINLDESIINHEAEITAINNELSKYNEWKINYSDAELKVKEQKKLIAKRIQSELGEEFNLESLMELQLSHVLNEEVGKYQEQFAQSQEHIRQLEDKYKTANQEIKTLSLTQKQHKIDLDSIDVRDNYLQIKDAYNTYKQLAPSRDYLKQRIDDLKAPKTKPTPANQWVSLIGTLLMTVLSCYFFVLNKWYFGGLGLIFVAYNLRSYFAVKKQEKRDLAAWQVEETERMEEIVRLKNELEEKQKYFVQAERILNLDRDDLPEALTKLGEELIIEGEKWTKKQKLTEKLTEIESEKQALENQLVLLANCLKEEKEKAGKLKEDWESFLSKNKLPLKEPLNILAWLSAARELQARAEELKNKQKEKDLLGKNLSEFEAKVAQLALSLKLEKPIQVALAVLDWQNQLKRNLEILKKKNELIKIIGELDFKINEFNTKIKSKQKERSLLLKKGQVKTVDDFRILAKKATQKEQFKRDIAQIEFNLNSLVKEKKELLYRELSEASDETLELKKNKNGAELTKLREKETEINEALGRLAEKVSQLEKSSESEKLLLTKIDLSQKLNNVAKKWSEIELCRYLITKARQVYEREKQPGVLKTASKYFEAITAKRYQRVISPLMEQRFEVITNTQEIKKPEELSRGTLEQLYLCLRLGLIEEFAKHQFSLPLVFDDILVNFDPIRTNSTLQILSSLEMHQVLFFTCQPHLIDICEDNKINYSLTKIELTN